MLKKELDPMNRKKVILSYAKLYQKTPSKKKKSQILNEFTHLIGYNHSYASWLLRNAGKKVQIKTPEDYKIVLVAQPNRKIKRKRPKFMTIGFLSPSKKFGLFWTFLVVSNLRP